jgi:hypothetical protein
MRSQAGTRFDPPPQARAFAISVDENYLIKYHLLPYCGKWSTTLWIRALRTWPDRRNMLPVATGAGEKRLPYPSPKEIGKAMPRRPDRMAESRQLFEETMS